MNHNTASILDHLIHEPANLYHSKRDQYLSSHRLADFRDCPRLFRDKELGMVTDKDSSAYTVGRAAHCLTLEGRAAYKKDFAIGGPINERTGKPYGRDTQAFAKWAKEQSGEIITESEARLVERLAEAVHAHPLAKELLSDGVAEGVVRTTLHNTACQIRCDWLNPTRGLVDLKTCDSLKFFESDARKWRYMDQLAFYRAALRVATGETVPVHIIAVEKQAPHRVGVWVLDDRRLDDAECDNQAAMIMLEACRNNDTWPTGYEHLQILS